MYSDTKKKEYMRMFFKDQPFEFCKYTIDRLKLTDTDRKLLTMRYSGKSDKVIARALDLSPDHINKQINNALIHAYDSLKCLQYNDYLTTK